MPMEICTHWFPFPEAIYLSSTAIKLARFSSSSDCIIEKFQQRILLVTDFPLVANESFPNKFQAFAERYHII